MLTKLWKLWMHPHTQEVLGVIFFLLLIHDIIQSRWLNVALDVVVIFSAVQLIRRGNK